MSGPHQIAVIGAGIAGLACAAALQAAGLAVSVFEKSRGLGGRMSTRLGDDWQCDHGAQYFTARNQDFRAEVLRWQKAGAADLWTPKLEVMGNTPHLHSHQSIERFVGTPSMTSPAHFLANNISVTSKITVQQIEQRDDGWHLYSGEDGWLRHRFAAVLLAIPAPQVVPLLQLAAPEMSLLARAVNMHSCWSLMLHFSTPTQLPFDAAFVNADPLSWITRNSSKPQRDGKETWLLHASEAWSEAHLEQEKDWVAQALLQAFYQLGGSLPDAWVAHRWRYAKADPALDLQCCWNAQQRIGLCGDWLHGGKVEGAWLSGSALARQVTQYYAD
jgi:renalase